MDKKPVAMLAFFGLLALSNHLAASSSPDDGMKESPGVRLERNCGSHCGGHTAAPTGSPGQHPSDSVIAANYETYSMNLPYNPAPINMPYQNVTSMPSYYQPPSSSSYNYNTNRMTTTSSGYQPPSKTTEQFYPSTSTPSADTFGSTTHTYQNYAPPAYNYSPQGYIQSSQPLVSEAQLLQMLNPQTRALYLSLTPQAKALALQIASQPTYSNKNMAVREAARRYAEQQGMMLPQY